MERPIKFRAWDKENQKMWDDAFAVNEGGDTIIVSQKSIFHNPDYIITDRLILMQYTGLKDKHGTEIYEGDIVRGRNDMFDFGEDVLFEIGWLPEEKGYGMHWNPDEVEVVGNLFGSPDLMEGGK